MSNKINKRRKCKFYRDLYVFEFGLLVINSQHSKSRAFHKWYHSDSMVVPDNLDNIWVNFLKKTSN